MRLALVDDINMLTAEEAKTFAKHLDLFVGDLRKPGLIKTLLPFWKKGREYLCANSNSLLISKRHEIIEQLRKLGKLGNLKISVLKHYSKRLGVNILEIRGRKNLELALNNLLSMGVHSHVAEYKEYVVNDIKASEGQSENIAVQAPALPQSISNSLLVQNVFHEFSKATTDTEFDINFITQQKHSSSQYFDHGLHVVGPVTLPNGIEYDRIFNVGGGDCFFLSVCQGCQFFGINIDHVELRMRVGQWIQGHAYLLQTHLEIEPIDLHAYLTWFPAPPGGWWDYLWGMDWVQWGLHVEHLGEWVGPLEVNPTNHVLEEMGYDLRVNIWSPDDHYILGNEANINEDGIEKPLIIIMCRGGHYEWLRMKTY